MLNVQSTKPIKKMCRYNYDAIKDSPLNYIIYGKYEFFNELF